LESQRRRVRCVRFEEICSASAGRDNKARPIPKKPSRGQGPLTIAIVKDRDVRREGGTEIEVLRASIEERGCSIRRNQKCCGAKSNSRESAKGEVDGPGGSRGDGGRLKLRFSCQRPGCQEGSGGGGGGLEESFGCFLEVKHVHGELELRGHENWHFLGAAGRSTEEGRKLV